MPPNKILSKEQEKARSDALNELGAVGNDDIVESEGKQPNSSESEGLKRNQQIIASPNNYPITNLDELGPVAQDLEIERREGYLKNKGFGM